MNNLCKHCGLHKNKWSSDLHPCYAGLSHEADIAPHEISDVENIVCRAKAGRDLAIDSRNNSQVDNYEIILVYARGLLPEGNRFKYE